MRTDPTTPLPEVGTPDYQKRLNEQLHLIVRDFDIRLDTIEHLLGNAPGRLATDWVAYTPTITSGAGAFTTVSAIGRYRQLVETVFVQLKITATTVGTAATAGLATLPVSAKTTIAFQGSGREQGTGIALTAYGNSATQVGIQKYDGTFAPANGWVMAVQFCYEAA